jgi:hypothetical protein
MEAWCALIQNQRGKNGRYCLRPGSRKIPGGLLENLSRARVSSRRHAIAPYPLNFPFSPSLLALTRISVPQTQASRAARRGKLEQASWRPFHPSLLGLPLAEHPLASSPRFIDPPVAGAYPFLSSRSTTSYTPWKGRSRYCLRFWKAFSLPRSVFGPVLNPPCNRHRPFAIASHRQGVPRRVRAPQSGHFLSSCFGMALITPARSNLAGVGVHGLRQSTPARADCWQLKSYG